MAKMKNQIPDDDPSDDVPEWLKPCNTYCCHLIAYWKHLRQNHEDLELDDDVQRKLEMLHSLDSLQPTSCLMNVDPQNCTDITKNREHREADTKNSGMELWNEVNTLEMHSPHSTTNEELLPQYLRRLRKAKHIPIWMQSDDQSDVVKVETGISERVSEFQTSQRVEVTRHESVEHVTNEAKSWNSQNERVNQVKGLDLGHSGHTDNDLLGEPQNDKTYHFKQQRKQKLVGFEWKQRSTLDDEDHTQRHSHSNEEIHDIERGNIGHLTNELVDDGPGNEQRIETRFYPQNNENMHESKQRDLGAKQATVNMEDAWIQHPPSEHVQGDMITTHSDDSTESNPHDVDTYSAQSTSLEALVAVDHPQRDNDELQNFSSTNKETFHQYVDVTESPETQTTDWIHELRNSIEAQQIPETEQGDGDLKQETVNIEEERVEDQPMENEEADVRQPDKPQNEQILEAFSRKNSGNELLGVASREKNGGMQVDNELRSSRKDGWMQVDNDLRETKENSEFTPLQMNKMLDSETGSTYFGDWTHSSANTQVLDGDIDNVSLEGSSTENESERGELFESTPEESSESDSMPSDMISDTESSASMEIQSDYQGVSVNVPQNDQSDHFKRTLRSELDTVIQQRSEIMTEAEIVRRLSLDNALIDTQLDGSVTLSSSSQDVGKESNVVHTVSSTLIDSTASSTFSNMPLNSSTNPTDSAENVFTVDKKRIEVQSASEIVGESKSQEIQFDNKVLDAESLNISQNADDPLIDLLVANEKRNKSLEPRSISLPSSSISGHSMFTSDASSKSTRHQLSNQTDTEVIDSTAPSERMQATRHESVEDVVNEAKTARSWNSRNERVIDSLSKAHAVEIELLTAKVEELQLNRTQPEWDRMSDENVELRKALKSMSRERDTLKSKLAIKDNESIENQQQIKNLMDERQGNRQMIESLKHELASLSNEYGRGTMQRKSVQSETERQSEYNDEPQASNGEDLLMRTNTDEVTGRKIQKRSGTDSSAGTNWLKAGDPNPDSTENETLRSELDTAIQQRSEIMTEAEMERRLRLDNALMETQFNGSVTPSASSQDAYVAENKEMDDRFGERHKALGSDHIEFEREKEKMTRNQIEAERELDKESNVVQKPSSPLNDSDSENHDESEQSDVSLDQTEHHQGSGEIAQSDSLDQNSDANAVKESLERMLDQISGDGKYDRLMNSFDALAKETLEDMLTQIEEEDAVKECLEKMLVHITEENEDLMVRDLGTPASTGSTPRFTERRSLDEFDRLMRSFDQINTEVSNADNFEFSASQTNWQTHEGQTTEPQPPPAFATPDSLVKIPKNRVKSSRSQFSAMSKEDVFAESKQEVLEDVETPGNPDENPDEYPNGNSSGNPNGDAMNDEFDDMPLRSSLFGVISDIEEAPEGTDIDNGFRESTRFSANLIPARRQSKLHQNKKSLPVNVYKRVSQVPMLPTAMDLSVTTVPDEVPNEVVETGGLDKGFGDEMDENESEEKEDRNEDADEDAIGAVKDSLEQMLDDISDANAVKESLEKMLHQISEDGEYDCLMNREITLLNKDGDKSNDSRAVSTDTKKQGTDSMDSMLEESPAVNDDYQIRCNSMQEEVAQSQKVNDEMREKLSSLKLNMKSKQATTPSDNCQARQREISDLEGTAQSKTTNCKKAVKTLHMIDEKRAILKAGWTAIKRRASRVERSGEQKSCDEIWKELKRSNEQRAVLKRGWEAVARRITELENSRQFMMPRNAQRKRHSTVLAAGGRTNGYEQQTSACADVWRELELKQKQTTVLKAGWKGIQERICKLENSKQFVLVTSQADPSSKNLIMMDFEGHSDTVHVDEESECEASRRELEKREQQRKALAQGWETIQQRVLALHTGYKKPEGLR